jgi:acyl-CoA synthetase (NDP forming)
VVSHTGALAGADRSYDALFAQSGVIRAMSFSSLPDIPASLACGRRLAGNHIAILAATGGVAALVSDSLGLGGFSLCLRRMRTRLESCAHFRPATPPCWTTTHRRNARGPGTEAVDGRDLRDSKAPALTQGW